MVGRKKFNITRRDFLKLVQGGALLSCCGSLAPPLRADTAFPNDVFWVENIPAQPYYEGIEHNYHAGVDCLLQIMGEQGLKLYRSSKTSLLAGPQGLIETGDVVLIKVNAQWKYRGCTNSDVVRGLIQRILNHPDGFSGEVVIFENGQRWGSLNCDTKGWWDSSYPDGTVHANANDESHSFHYLRDSVFNDPRVSCYLLDPIREVFIGANDHTTDGYRTLENVSYPCFTTPGGHRVELKEGIWKNGSYHQNLKLINVPVLKHHDTGGSEITASLKHVYGILTMSDGQSGGRHYSALGETCGKMMASVRAPVLNIMDAIWVSHKALEGWPSYNTVRVNQLLASQDPAALDYWAAKYTLYPINNNARHHPDFSGIQAWLQSAVTTINSRGGLQDSQQGIQVGNVTASESQMSTHTRTAEHAHKKDLVGSWSNQGVYYRNAITGYWNNLYHSCYIGDVGDMNGDGIDDLVGVWWGVSGIWVRYSASEQWELLASTPTDLALGDMTGNGRTDLLGTWSGDGVYYRNSVTGAWVKMASPAEKITAGDLDGDGIDDLIGTWPSQGGVWVKFSSTGQWEQLANSPSDITTGDMTGNGRADLVGNWSAQGVFFRDSVSGTWVKIATPATAIGVGDLDGDGIDDLIGVWPGQGGVWVKYSSTGQWENLASAAVWVSAGKMRSIGHTAGGTLSRIQVSTTAAAGGPMGNMDQAPPGPGASGFRFSQLDKLDLPQRVEGKRPAPVGPGHPRFRFIEQPSLNPGSDTAPRRGRSR